MADHRLQEAQPSPSPPNRLLPPLRPAPRAPSAPTLQTQSLPARPTGPERTLHAVRGGGVSSRSRPPPPPPRPVAQSLRDLSRPPGAAAHPPPARMRPRASTRNGMLAPPGRAPLPPGAPQPRINPRYDPTQRQISPISHPAAPAINFQGPSDEDDDDGEEE
ncbi:hypothetical protein F4778DRAFT_686338 [Xylariomycetidae sp. FL2044]|nr:hypothetical protein F4778DRAFT_686338 [Xylariomycetidae sp. FL2044]